MIEEFLRGLLFANIALCGAALLVLALRSAFRRWFGAEIAYALWWLVPMSMLAVLLPARTVEVNVPGPTIAAELAMTPNVNTQALAAPASAFAIDVSLIVFSIWLLGACLMFSVQLLRRHSFVRSLGRLDRQPDGTLLAEHGSAGPAVIGVFNARLVIPKSFADRFDATEREWVLKHERVHLWRSDARINGIAALVQCVCWFNPLAHWAVRSMRIDQELACDAVVARRHPGSRRTYAAAMLKAQLAPMNVPLGCQWQSKDPHPLRLRIEMMKDALPNSRRRVFGSALSSIACLLAGTVAWAAQPPREVPSRFDAAPPTEVDEQLLRAVSKGNPARAKTALDAGANPDVRSNRGLPALTIAARADDIRILTLLLEYGANVHALSPNEGNALVAAARRGHTRSVATLIEYGAIVNEIVPEQGTPLAASVRTGHFEVVKQLVEHGANVNLASPPAARWDKWRVIRTPLEFAEGGHHTEIADYLRAAGAK